MHSSFQRVCRGELVYYICNRLPVRHAFTTKAGGVSTGDCKSLNLGFHRGDLPENVTENYRRLSAALKMPYERMMLTHQIHSDEVSAVGERDVGTGLTKPMAWDSDALVTALPNTPLAGFYADCVVTILYDEKSHSCGVCHTGWRGVGNGILAKTVEKMAQEYGADKSRMIAVMGPSIHACCFETDADVPDVLAQMLGGDRLSAHMTKQEKKWYIDLQGINTDTLRLTGLKPDNILDSGICTQCNSEEFWSHRATHGKRGVQAGVVCL